MIAYKNPYVEYLLKGNGKGDQCPKKKKFAERIRWGEEGIISDVNTGEVEWEVKNMPTVGEGFGFLIISRGYQEWNHLDECYQ